MRSKARWRVWVAVAAATVAGVWAEASRPVAAEGGGGAAGRRAGGGCELMRENRPDMVDVLAEIRDLPRAGEADLMEVRRRAAVLDKSGPKDERTQVRYYGGVSHGLHGLLPRGHNDPGMDPRQRPADDRWHAEHHLDADGRLTAVYAHRPGKGYALTDQLVYEGGDLVARLTYGEEGFAFGDYGCYREGRLHMVARIDTRGRMISYERIAYVGGREDYTVRYVDGGDGRMVLESVALASGARLQLDKPGRVTAFWAPTP